jgi:hypothetical protein
MRRPLALPLLLASAALLVPLAAGCSSGGKHATAAGASATAAAPVGAAASGSGAPAPGTSAGVTGGEGPAGTAASPSAGTVKVPSGTVSYGWFIGTSGSGSVRVALGNRLVNTATNKAATKYLQTHGGGSVPGETPVDHVDVDLGTTRTYPISSSAVVVTTAKGSVPQRLNVAGFLAWLRTHLAKPLPVSMRLTYRGAPHYSGPLWMITVRGGVIVAIGHLT